jgi:hypothetical protein
MLAESFVESKSMKKEESYQQKCPQGDEKCCGDIYNDVDNFSHAFFLCAMIL